MPFLNLNSIVKRFGEVEVLHDIRVEADRGDFVVLVGPSGCGKSTLLNIIAGLETHDGGAVEINGRNVSGVRPADRDIAMVFQSYALYPNMTVAENIAFSLEMRGTPKPEREKAVKGAASLLQIDHLLDRKPAQLSGGQRQRVAIGRALVRSPLLYLFDEPLSNLDARLRVEMRTEIKKLHQTTGATIVYVTHDQIEALTLSTKVVVMKDGIIQQQGPPQEVYSRPSNIFVADFMGSLSMNLFDGVVSAAGDEMSVAIQTGRGTFNLPAAPSDKPILSKRAGTKVIVGLRPENITDLPDSNAATNGSIECSIGLLEPFGSETVAIFEIAGKNVQAKLHADTKAKVGDHVVLSANMDKANYFDPASGMRIASADATSIDSMMMR